MIPGKGAGEGVASALLNADFGDAGAGEFDVDVVFEFSVLFSALRSSSSFRIVSQGILPAAQ